MTKNTKKIIKTFVPFVFVVKFHFDVSPFFFLSATDELEKNHEFKQNFGFDYGNGTTRKLKSSNKTPISKFPVNTIFFQL